MIRGLYTAASGLAAGERLQELLVNNLANANTPGYKEDDGTLRSFPEELLFRLTEPLAGTGGAERPQTIGTLGTGVALDETLPRFTAGTVTQTDRKTDFAVEDDPGADAGGNRGFFAVNTPAGTAYTRDGQFVQDADGRLFTADGRGEHCQSRRGARQTRAEPVPSRSRHDRPARAVARDRPAGLSGTRQRRSDADHGRHDPGAAQLRGEPESDPDAGQHVEQGGQRGRPRVRKGRR
jgi:flagellar hook-basal body protein